MSSGTDFFIRADASSEMGTGHIVRCVTLAESLRALGHRPTFLCRLVPEAMTAWITKEKQFPVLIIDDSFDSEINESSIRQLEPHFLSAPSGVLIVDHYDWGAKQESAGRRFFEKIFVIDDLANRPHDCDILVDQNFFLSPQKRYRNLVGSGCELLLGPEYALLRSEFSRERQRLEPRDGMIRNVMVSFGGADPYCDTLTAIRGLALLNFDDVKVEVLVGVACAGWEVIQNEARKYGFSFHRNVPNMAEHMAGADLFIGAGGSATWERLCLGLPSLVFSIADNQHEFNRDLAFMGYQSYLGGREHLTPETVASAVREFFDSPMRCRSFAENALSLVDGLGAQRVAASFHKALFRELPV